jgi:hypothetical protein
MGRDSAAGRSVSCAAIRLGVGVAVCLAAALASGQAPERTEADLEEYTEVRLRTARIRIDPTYYAKPGDCLGLTVDDLKVSLRGDRIEGAGNVVLERDRRPTLHALLIDTSGSMNGKLTHVRRAAAEYLRGLDPEYDRALVATFDESLLLMAGATSDREELVQAVENVRMAGATTMHDGLYYIIHELDGHRDRSVVLLLSDGVDTASLYERNDILDLIATRPRLSIFSIGLTLPSISDRGPPGVKKYLYRLSNRTNGKFFDVPVGSRLDKAYLRIREMLENEADLTIVDPDTEAPPGKIRVSSRNPSCKVKIFRERAVSDHPSVRPIEEPPPALPVRYSLDAPGFYGRPTIRSTTAVIDPACIPVDRGVVFEKKEIADAWYLEAEPGRIHGCTLDVTQEYGAVYRPLSAPVGMSMSGNTWLGLKTRPFTFDVPPPESLPRGPVAAMDALADLAHERAELPVEIHPLNVPPEIHARPYHDLPMLIHGTRFLEMRPRIARALYAHDEYRDWVMDQLRAEVDRDMAALEKRYRRRFPDASDAAIKQAARLSEEGQEILLRARAPSEVDLQRHLVAWLGDIPAHDLFVAWEAEQINTWLRAGPQGSEIDRAVERWRDLRRVLYVPSYTRVLTLLALTHDPERDRIGFWRIVLPRPGWIRTRKADYGERDERSNLPLDLVPDLPLGLWTMAHVDRTDPRLAARLRRSRLVSIDYRLNADRRFHDPEHGFDETRVTMTFETSRVGTHAGDSTLIRLVAELSRDEESGSPVVVSLATALPGGSETSTGGGVGTALP